MKRQPTTVPMASYLLKFDNQTVIYIFKATIDFLKKKLTTALQPATFSAKGMFR